MKKKAKTPARFAVDRVLPDAEAESHGYLRIVDESGEDYGYAADRFFSIEVPKLLQRALLKAAS